MAKRNTSRKDWLYEDQPLILNIVSIRNILNGRDCPLALGRLNQLLIDSFSAIEVKNITWEKLRREMLFLLITSKEKGDALL